MIKDLFEFYKIGKELGLTKKEISNVLFSRNKVAIIIFYLIILIFIAFWAISILILHVNITRNTYPAGAEYSSVKMKDFQKRRSRRKNEIKKPKRGKKRLL